MVVTLWSVWYARRKAIYEAIFQSPQQTIMFVNNFIAELEQLPGEVVRPSVQPASVVQAQRWLPPTVGAMKINADGAVAKNRHGGAVAALCRDANGNYLGSSAVVFQGTNDPVILETYACREALALAEDLSITHMVVASDCQGVVNDINEGTGGPHAAIIHEIKHRSTTFSTCTFIHERRNFNFEAHNLAKFACKLGLGRHVWLGSPHDPSRVPMNIAIQ
jgi:ribonuclease HI